MTEETKDEDYTGAVLKGRELEWAVNSPELLAEHKQINGKIVRTRFPPEPNGYLHIGHAKSMNMNFSLAFEKLKVPPEHRRCIFRYDDTNPDAESEEYIDSLERDVKWLGWVPERTTYSSDNFQKLHDMCGGKEMQAQHAVGLWNGLRNLVHIKVGRVGRQNRVGRHAIRETCEDLFLDFHRLESGLDGQSGAGSLRVICGQQKTVAASSGAGLIQQPTCQTGLDDFGDICARAGRCLFARFDQNHIQTGAQHPIGDARTHGAAAHDGNAARQLGEARHVRRGFGRPFGKKHVAQCA